MTPLSILKTQSPETGFTLEIFRPSLPMSGPVTPGRRNDDYDQAQQQVPANGPAHAVGLEVRLGPVFLLDRGAKVLVWGVIKVPEDQYHGDAEHLHDVHVKACLREPAEPGEEHPVACDQEQRDRPPDPGEVPAEHLGEEAEALGRLNADGGGAQDQKDKEEARRPRPARQVREARRR